MNSTFVPSSQFPPWFRQELTKTINLTVNAGECGQIIGLPGSGLSSFINQYTAQQTKPDKSIFIYDLSTTGPTEIEALKIQLTTILQNNSKKLVVFFESADRLRDPRFLDLITAVAGWRRAYISQVSFFFGFYRPLGNNSDDSNLKPIWHLLGENQLFVPLLNTKESQWYAKVCAAQYGLPLTQTTLEKVIQLAGGYPRIIKRLIQCLNKNITIDQIANNPRLDIHLAYSFVLMLDNLVLEKEDLLKLAIRNANPTNNNLLQIASSSLVLLRQLNIINTTDQFTLPLFATYLANAVSDNKCASVAIDLTANECKLFEILKQYLDQIVSRETIIKFVWGEKGWEVNEHALDQLVHRLKEKLVTSKSEYQIQTLRGRGFRLNS